MAKSKSKENKEIEKISKARADAKAAAATEPKSRTKAANRPVSTDIRQSYKRSLLGDYLGTHRGQPAIKPKKK